MTSWANARVKLHSKVHFGLRFDIKQFIFICPEIFFAQNFSSKDVFSKKQFGKNDLVQINGPKILFVQN